MALGRRLVVMVRASADNVVGHVANVRGHVGAHIGDSANTQFSGALSSAGRNPRGTRSRYRRSERGVAAALAEPRRVRRDESPVQGADGSLGTSEPTSVSRVPEVGHVQK